MDSRIRRVAPDNTQWYDMLKAVLAERSHCGRKLKNHV